MSAGSLTSNHVNYLIWRYVAACCVVIWFLPGTPTSRSCLSLICPAGGSGIYKNQVRTATDRAYTLDLMTIKNGSNIVDRSLHRSWRSSCQTPARLGYRSSESFICAAYQISRTSVTCAERTSVSRDRTINHQPGASCNTSYSETDITR